MLNDALTMERNTIEDAVGGLTLVDVLARNARSYPDRPAIAWRESGKLEHLTWQEYRSQVLAIAVGLLELGVEPGDAVAIMAANRPEHVIADLGAVHARATPVTVYSTFAPAQVAYVADDCKAKVAIVEDAETAKLWLSIRHDLPALDHIVVLGGDAPEGASTWSELLESGRARLGADPVSIENVTAGVQPHDLATLIYTSGTTGEPKGVELSQANVLWTLETMGMAVDLPAHPKLVSYLPLAHIAERAASHYLGMWLVGEVTYCSNVASIMNVLRVVRPHLFVGVPRIWEKLYQRVWVKLDGEEDPRRRRLTELAIESGRQVLDAEQFGEKPSPLTAAKLAGLDRLVLSRIRSELGFDQLSTAITTAGPIDRHIVAFFRSVGVPLHELYGMTECCGPVTSNVNGFDKLGTVGRPLAGVEIRVDSDGELLIRGGNVTPGYYRDEEATAAAIDEEGWLRTGDLGTIDREGYLTIVGRKKELIVTAGGKNIAPVHLEHLLQRHPLVGHACVVGDRRPYLVAVLALDPEQLAAAFGDTEAPVVELPEVQAAVEAAVAAANAEVARVEQVKKYALVADDWTPESGLLTPSFKLRRSIVQDRYRDLIDALYG